MELMINGQDHDLPSGTRLSAVVTRTTGRELHPDGTPVDGGRLGVAVALDAVVVPRSRWASTELADGQSIEIITAMQGG